MPETDITFITACFYKDWEYILKTDYLDQMILRCGIPFKNRWLLINNVDDPARVKRYAQKKVDRGVIDAYYFTAEYIDQALEFFSITRDSFRKPEGGDGYYYSIADLVGLYLCQTAYVLTFTGDAIMTSGPHQWIQEACRIMDERPEYVVANPTWNNDYAEARSESLDGRTEGNFYVGYGFSDQCYLVRTADFKAPIYGYSHPESARYPAYGGEPFEKRVDAWMRCKGLMRLTSTKESYLHRNFPHTQLKRAILYAKFKLGIF